MKPLGECISFTPEPFDQGAASEIGQRLADQWNDFSSNERALINGVAGCSPFLKRTMLRKDVDLLSILKSPLDGRLKTISSDARGIAKLGSPDEQNIALRTAKANAALTIALADISSAVDTMTAAEYVSEFADAAVGGALSAALSTAGFTSQEESGFAIIAMGKHGAGELNYSSDIDFIAIYDPDVMPARFRDEARKTAVAITKEMINLLQSQTKDGYVFRTDLRLRPDPGVSPLAVTLAAIESYYESYGQNWERMAYIKSRFCAGDASVGERFMDIIRPFVWRRYLDFASIEDVKAVKRQIHASKGGADIEFAGHDIKTGAGGIREIEFYVQTQQLILGGRSSELRKVKTLDGLEALVRAEQVTPDTAEKLSSAYRTLRKTEHRLQMINDEQTHKIPMSENDINRLACFLGRESAAALEASLRKTFASVRDAYSDLFELEAEEYPSPGTLVFTGVDDHSETLKTLERMGFRRPSDVSAAIRHWHAGGLRATRNARARNILTILMNPLLAALSRASDPDDAFFAFEKFLAGLPSGVQVFSLLANNTEIFDTLIKMMTISPFLAREFSRHPNFVERLLENDWSAPPPDLDEYRVLLKAAAARASYYEEKLNAVRRWAGEQNFLITSQHIAGLLPPTKVGKYYSAIADACIDFSLSAVGDEIRRQHGALDAQIVVLGLGRLGDQSMTAASDIDLMFVYEADATSMSDGVKPLGGAEYCGRLVRRLITALSAATEEGGLYEVDMQLRPSGASGPAAVSFTAFSNYYEKDAWTWEIMALTKARFISGAERLRKKVKSEVEDIICRKRDRVLVAKDVRDMRNRLASAKPPKNLWDVKNTVGGLTDIAFIIQYLNLVTSCEHGCGPLDTASAIARFAEMGELDNDDAAFLTDAQSMFDALLQTGRAATAGGIDMDCAGDGLKEMVFEFVKADDIEQAEQNLIKIQARVADVFNKIVPEQKS
ncbi:MAG: bifunctional [glutamine synthetase] adenylyltransferase/[glutamine synthetase]-adenylyl-L-tyrosine phosphorylase [Marinicaulis sp.]|nr:bifunctional [glutamine synthetase] adenylyltransferase/[glutamine synthetase]-adenylyl-L-tyrosine phosphorylase [Marinicaulis sp.]